MSAKKKKTTRKGSNNLFIEKEKITKENNYKIKDRAKYIIEYFSIQNDWIDCARTHVQF